MTHVVELIGSNSAKLGDLTFTHQRKGVIGPLLRRAVKLGIVKEDDDVIVVRNGTTVFNPCKVSGYTEYTYYENDAGISRRKYVPYDKYNNDE